MAMNEHASENTASPISDEPPPVLAYQSDTSSVSRWDIAFLGCRFFAIYAVLQTVPNLSYIGFAMLPRSFQWEVFATICLVLGTCVAVAIVLWTQAGYLAGWMLKDAVGAGGSAGPATASLQSIFISLIGLFIAAQAMPATVMLVVTLLWMPERGYYSLHFPIQVVFGVALFIGATGISHLWYRFRTAGLNPQLHHPEQEQPVTPQRPDRPQ